jgi:O-antigen ligase
MLVYVSRVPGSLSAKLAVILSLVAASALLYLGVGGLDAVFGFVLRESRFEDLQNVERLGGRTEYWGVAIPILLDQPFIGQGIGLRSRESGLSSSMHNAFLEAWVGAGLFGLAAFSAGLFATGLRLTGAAFGGRRSDSHYSKLVPDVALSASAVLAYLLVHGLTESILAGVNNFMSVPLLYCVVVAQAIHNTDWGSRKQKLP